MWGKYVNGTGPGMEGRGVLDVWGVIAQTGARGTWEWTVGSLGEVYQKDAELYEYASKRSGLDRSGPVQGRAALASGQGKG